LNEEKILEKTLKSLREFTSLEHEIVISDGGSTDQTLAIAEKYADKVIKHTGPGRQNISMGRNAGAAAAAGEFLVFIDADVFIPHINTFFARMLEAFEAKELDGLTVFVKVHKDKSKLLDRVIFGFVNYQYQLCNNYLGIGGASGDFQMIRASAFKKLGGYNETLFAGEDNDLFMRIAKHGKTYVIPDLIVWHTGRRAHKIGWAKLLSLWILNGIFMTFFKKSFSKEWKVIR